MSQIFGSIWLFVSTKRVQNHLLSLQSKSSEAFFSDFSFLSSRPVRFQLFNSLSLARPEDDTAFPLLELPYTAS